MARTSATLNCFSLTQQLDPAHWTWTEEEAKALEAAAAGDVGPVLEVVKARLAAKGMEVVEGYGITHDKDTREVWSEAYSKMMVETKSKHVHLVFKFAPKKGGTLAAIAEAVGVEVQYIEKAGKGRYGYDNLLSYLVHAKDGDKYPYSPEAVASLAGCKSYTALYMERRAEWEKGKAVKLRKRADASIDDLEQKILTGQVTRGQIVLTDEYYEIYARYKRRCDDAFSIYGERRAYKTIQALQDGDFKLTVFFITGAAGAGKTRFAKKFVHLLARVMGDRYGEEWRICQTAATNPLDDYAGEEILFMDDVRGGSLTASDWLKLLDPYNISPGSARYHNKIPACRCIVITSSKEPLEFFYYCKQIGGDRSEALDQFMRRIQSRVQVVRADEWAAPEYRIADGQKIPAALLPVPGAGVNVRLTYGFGDDKVMSDEGEAIGHLLAVVDENSDLVRKREADEAAEAAASDEVAAPLDGQIALDELIDEAAAAAASPEILEEVDENAETVL